jgi:alpha-D-ribose 1-methylphosphonate 5-phosphate C-P lyase
MKVNKRVYLTCKKCGSTQSITWPVEMGKPLKGSFQFVCKDRDVCKWSGWVKGSLKRPSAV